MGVEEEEGKDEKTCDGGLGGSSDERDEEGVILLLLLLLLLFFVSPSSSSLYVELRANEEGIRDIASATAVRAEEGEAAIRAATWRSRRSTCVFFGFFFGGQV